MNTSSQHGSLADYYFWFFEKSQCRLKLDLISKLSQSLKRVTQLRKRLYSLHLGPITPKKLLKKLLLNLGRQEYGVETVRMLKQ